MTVYMLTSRHLSKPVSMCSHSETISKFKNNFFVFNYWPCLMAANEVVFEGDIIAWDFSTRQQSEGDYVTPLK